MAKVMYMYVVEAGMVGCTAMGDEVGQMAPGFASRDHPEVVVLPVLPRRKFATGTC